MVLLMGGDRSGGQGRTEIPFLGNEPVDMRKDVVIIHVKSPNPLISDFIRQDGGRSSGMNGKGKEVIFWGFRGFHDE
ncbi:hypothetical protein GCM10010156_03290 [Planobispora rosea]|uniref:Uncharacterized protein n=1 Tax=Planobispora rosea TaxID=35762 RepID=A0A8J3WAR1_PLARO|nr:hypothetical protein GCM10010156_03290 [Planobispora rosea]GIH82158.1 hypothetical protein Pro02_05660 [Planobispora rosea]